MDERTQLATAFYNAERVTDPFNLKSCGKSFRTGELPPVVAIVGPYRDQGKDYLVHDKEMTVKERDTLIRTWVQCYGFPAGTLDIQ